MVKRVLQIGDDHREADRIRQGIEQAGYSVVTLIGTKDDITAISMAAYPDLIVISVKMLDGFVLSQLKKVIRTHPCPTVVFASKSTDQQTREAISAGISAFIVDGFSPERVKPIFSLATARFEEVQGLKAKLKDTQQALSDRKLIDKAKGVLMSKSGMSEDEAYKKLRTMAMAANLKIPQVAKNVIMMESEMLQN